MLDTQNRDVEYTFRFLPRLERTLSPWIKPLNKGNALGPSRGTGQLIVHGTCTRNNDSLDTDKGKGGFIMREQLGIMKENRKDKHGYLVFNRGLHARRDI